jgi:hypothetical protein
LVVKTTSLLSNCDLNVFLRSSNNEGYNGEIESLQIYNRDLTMAEIETNMFESAKINGFAVSVDLKGSTGEEDIILTFNDMDGNSETKSFTAPTDWTQYGHFSKSRIDKIDVEFTNDGRTSDGVDKNVLIGNMYYFDEYIRYKLMGQESYTGLTHLNWSRKFTYTTFNYVELYLKGNAGGERISIYLNGNLKYNDRTLSTSKVYLRMDDINEITALKCIFHNGSGGSNIFVTHIKLNDQNILHQFTTDMNLPSGRFIKDIVSDDFESFGIQKLLNGDILAIMDNNSHIFRSSDKGNTWYRLADLPFVKATYAPYAILSTGEIICLDDTVNNRIWSSKDNGNSWTKVSDDAGLGGIELSRFGMCVLPDDTIIMVGGNVGTNNSHINDVWILELPTYQFSIQNSNPGFSNTVNNVTFNDGYTIYNVFGQSAVENSELWKSNDKGLTWEFVVDMVTETGSARYGAGALVANDKIYISGGREKFVTNGGENSDVWQSSDGGYTWEQIDNIPISYSVQAPGLIYYEPSTIVRISTASNDTLKQLRSDDNGYNWYEIITDTGIVDEPSNGNWYLGEEYGSGAYFWSP